MAFRAASFSVNSIQLERVRPSDLAALRHISFVPSVTLSVTFASLAISSLPSSYCIDIVLLCEYIVNTND